MNTTSHPTLRRSVCPLDCPDTCSLEVTVSDNHIRKVRGSYANPYTAGAICDKVANYYPDFVHGTHRLTKPLRLVGEKGSGEFEVVAWDDALGIIAERTHHAINQYGPQSVLPFNYAGPHGQLAGGSMDRRFFHRMGASLLDRGPLCGAVRGNAYTSLFGAAPGMPPEYAVGADLIAVWGNNATVSNLHLARVIKQARKRGAKLIVVDPKRIRIAEQAHLFVQIAPGTDVVLALALAAEMERRGKTDHEFVATWVTGAQSFMSEARKYTLSDAARICHVPFETISAMAELYAGAANLALSIGNGIERGRSGGSGLRAIMSVSVMLGQLGRMGAGIIAKPGAGFPTTPDKLQRPDLVPTGTRTLNIVDVGKHLLHDDLDPPVRSVFIYNHNPIATHPDQETMVKALLRPALFLTGIDVVMTDSMKYCDVILPAASHFEFHDIYTAYGQNYLQRAEPVIPCVGDALPNTEIFRRLAQVFGYDDPIFKAGDHELMDDAIDANDPRLEGYRPSALPTDRAFMMKTPDGEPPIMCNTVKPATLSGRVELFSQELEDQFGFGTPRYDPVDKDRPFTVISPSSRKRTNATFGSDPASHGLEQVEIHPDDAVAKGIQDGAIVRLENQRGGVTLQAKISDAMQTGVLYTPKGTWLATSETNRTINALIPADIRTDIMSGACYNETFADIFPV